MECPLELQGYVEGQVVHIQGEVYKLEDKVTYTNVYVKLQSGSNLIIVDVNNNYIEIGNIILISGNLMMYEVARNPGNFNAKVYYQNQGIYASVYLQKMEILDDTKDAYRQYLYEIRKKGIATLCEVIGEKNASLLSAMIFGDKSRMDGEQKERFQKVGISHIFAISGLHISLLCMATYYFVRKRTGSFLIAAVVGCYILFSYVLITGISISAVRAGMMFVVRVMGDVSGRVYDTRTSLSVAGIYLLGNTPTYLFDGGYLLSFGAIIGVIYLLPILHILLKRYGRFGKMLGASVGIHLILLPIMFQNFYEVCLYSLGLNLLIVPCMPFLLFTGILGLSTYELIEPVSKCLFHVCNLLLNIIDKLSIAVLNFPYSRIVLGEIWWPVITVYYIGLIILIYWGNGLCKKDKILDEKFGKEIKIKKGITKEEPYGHIEDTLRSIIKRRRKHFFIILLLLPSVLLIKKPAADLSVTMIDVGQGDSIFISGPTGGRYLIDGGSTDINNVGRYRIESFLLSQGVKEIDYVFISHGDADHYNGVAEMMERQSLGVKINNLVLVEEAFLDDKLRALAVVAQECNVRVLTMAAGNTIQEDELKLVCVAPEKNYNGEIGNASSMVLDISYDEFDMLFTGDLEGDGEIDFIRGKYNLNNQYEVLKVAHHGSKNSTPLNFLELVNPSLCIISAGVNSRYGHPHTDLIERLELYTQQIWVTSEVGAIQIEYDKVKKNIKVKSFL